MYPLGVNDDILEGSVSGTEYAIRQVPDGEALVNTHVTADRSKLGRY